MLYITLTANNIYSATKTKEEKNNNNNKLGQEHGLGWCSVWVWFDSVAGDDGG